MKKFSSPLVFLCLFVSSLLLAGHQDVEALSALTKNVGRRGTFTKSEVQFYRKIPIISPRLIFVHKALLLGLFSGKLMFGGAYYWREFCVSK